MRWVGVGAALGAAVAASRALRDLNSVLETDVIAQGR
jgi:hypothetical protein